MYGARVTSFRPALLAVLALLAVASTTFAQAAPELPRASVDTSMPPQQGRTIAVGPGGDFQSALDLAQPGDVITLAAGATYVGPFTLPNKSGSGWIVVRTSASDSSLPPQGQRITPDYAGSLPKIVSTNVWPALQTATAAHHFRFVGVEFGLQGAPFSYGLVVVGDPAQTSLANVVNNVVFDRVLIRGQSNLDVRRGIAFNGTNLAVINSWISDIHEIGADTQAVGGWNGPGPFLIENNYLEAAGENIMFGGVDPLVYGLVPSDIVIRRNTITKQLSWRNSSWTVKNLLELKNAQRVLVDGNIFENNWAAAQLGWGLVLTPRNQSGSAPWSVVQDISITNNVIRRTGGAITILGADNLQASQPTRRIRIANNLFTELGGAWGGYGRLLQVLEGPTDLTVEHNTGLPPNEYLLLSGQPARSLAFRNNLMLTTQYGFAGDGTFGNTALTLATYFLGGSFTGNALVAANPVGFPVGNLFPPNLDSVGFVNYPAGDFRLAANSPFRNAAADGRDPGVDLGALAAALQGTEAALQPPSQPAPAPPASVDATPPQVAITAPGAQQVVSALMTLAASASDNVGVTAVQFAIDGIDVGALQEAAPYTVKFNTEYANDGTHVATVRARDAAGNVTTSAAVTFVIQNGRSAPPVLRAPEPTGSLTWSKALNVLASGGTVMKNGGCDGCQDAGASSAQTVAGDGYLEFTIAQTTAQLVVGLGTEDVDTSEADVDVAVKFWPGGSADVRVNGVYQGGSSDFRYSAGDVIRVSRTGAQITLSRNGTVMFQTGAPRGPLAIDTSFSAFGRIDDVRLVEGAGPAGSATSWTRVFNLLADAGTLIKNSGCDGCPDAGTSSSAAITTGRGYLEFVPGDTVGQRAIGLSTGDSDTSEGDIDFALKFWPGGTVDVRQNSAYLADTRYNVADVFRVSVDDGVITYSKNGEVFYRSSRTAGGPLNADTSFTTMGTRLLNVRLVAQ